MEHLYNLAFEKAILSTIVFEDIKDTEAKEINVLTFLSPDDFYLPAFSEIFKSMQDLYRKSIEIDENLIQLELEKKDLFDKYSDSLLSILTTNPVVDVSTYAKEIKKRKNLREILKLIPMIQAGVENFKEPGEILSEIIQESENLLSNQNFSNKIDSANDLLEKYKVHGPVAKVKTNFQPVDEVIPEGIAKGSLIIVAGESETGKTHVSFAIAEHTSLSTKVGIVSLEFGEDDYVEERLVKFFSAGIIKNPENILTNFDSFSINALVETLYRFASLGVELVVIESLHIIENDRYTTNKTDSVEDIVMRINQVIKKTGMICILIAFGSKTDYIEGKLGVKNSSSVPHLAKAFIRITEGSTKKESIMHWKKNKQTKKYPKQTLIFLEDGNIFLKNSKLENKTIISLAAQE